MKSTNVGTVSHAAPSHVWTEDGHFMNEATRSDENGATAVFRGDKCLRHLAKRRVSYPGRTIFSGRTSLSNSGCVT